MSTLAKLNFRVGAVDEPEDPYEFRSFGSCPIDFRAAHQLSLRKIGLSRIGNRMIQWVAIVCQMTYSLWLQSKDKQDLASLKESRKIQLSFKTAGIQRCGFAICDRPPPTFWRLLEIDAHSVTIAKPFDLPQLIVYSTQLLRAYTGCWWVSGGVESSNGSLLGMSARREHSATLKQTTWRKDS